MAAEAPPKHRRSAVRFSDASAPEWVPPAPWLPDVVRDAAYAAAAFVLTVAATSPSLRDAARVLLRPLVLLSGGGAASSAAAAVAASTATTAAIVAAGVFLAFRCLPEVSHRKLLEAEERLLASISGDVRHHWCRFATTSAAWHVHSLQLRAGGVGARPAVVLIHGHSAGAAHWESVLDRLGAHADVHVLDLPGWGRSPAPPELQSSPPQRCSELMAEMLAGWLDCNGLRRVTVLGHSFGGFNAVHFAHRYPDRVTQLVLVAPAGLTPVLPTGSLANGVYFKLLPPQRIARVSGRLGYLVFRTLYLAFTTEDRRFPDVYYQLAAATAAAGLGDVAAARYMRVAWDDGWRPRLFWSHPCLSLLMSLRPPVSVVWGQRDEIVAPLLGPLLHRLRPRTDLYLVDAALHNPAHNNVRAFCDAVLDALRKHGTLPGAPATLSARGARLGAAFADGTADALLEAGAQPTSTAAEVDAARAADTGADGAVAAAADGAGAGGARRRPLGRADAAGAAAAAAASGRAGDGHDDDGCGANHDADDDGPAPLPVPPYVPSRAPTSLALRRTAAAGASGASLASLSASLSAPLDAPRRPSAANSAAFGSESSSLPQSSGSDADGGADEDEDDDVGGDDGSRHEWHNDWKVRRAHRPHGARGGRRVHDAPRGTGSDGTGDGVTAPIGRGRGYCHGCFHAVSLFKSYWRCACGAWSFNALALSPAGTRAHFAAQLAFLDELYVYGCFDARTSRAIVLVLRPRSPLPAPHPPPAVAAMARLAAAAGGGGGVAVAHVLTAGDGAAGSAPGAALPARVPWPLEFDPRTGVVLGGLSPAQAATYGRSAGGGGGGGGGGGHSDGDAAAVATPATVAAVTAAACTAPLPSSPRAAAGLPDAAPSGTHTAGFAFKPAPADFPRGLAYLLA